MNVAESIVSNHLLAMKEGNKMARKLFPNLISWMEEVFKNKGEVDSIVQAIVGTFCETSVLAFMLYIYLFVGLFS